MLNVHSNVQVHKTSFRYSTVMSPKIKRSNAQAARRNSFYFLVPIHVVQTFRNQTASQRRGRVYFPN